MGTLFTTCVPSVNLWEWGWKLRQIKVSCNSHFYSEHQTIYTLRVKRSHMRKAYRHNDELHAVKTCFSRQAYKQIAVTSHNEWSEVWLLPWVTPGQGRDDSPAKDNPLQDSCLALGVFHKVSRVSSHSFVHEPCYVSTHTPNPHQTHEIQENSATRWKTLHLHGKLFYFYCHSGWEDTVTLDVTLIQDKANVIDSVMDCFSSDLVFNHFSIAQC